MNLGRESETVEFKVSISQLDKGLKSLTAMLNRHNHGTLYVGVDNNGNVIGIDIGKKTEEDIRNKIRSLVQPQIVPEITVCTSDDGRRYVSITASGFNIPYSCDGRYYIRNATSDENAGPDVVAQLVMSRGIDPLKDQPSDVQDLTFDQLFRMMDARGLHPRNDEGFFRSHGMTDSRGRFNMTAYLLSDQNSTPIQIVEFHGTDRSSVSSRTDYGGRSLPDSMTAVMGRMGSLMVTRSDLGGGQRVDTDLFDMESFREAWVNACVHNAWRAMIPPSVLVFDDRIEIVSYGTVPFPLSLDGFFAGDSRPVNRSLFELFTLLGLTEQSGHGVPTIVRSYGREAFSITDNGVTVTIPFAFEPDFVRARRENERHRSGLDRRSADVLACLEANPEAKLSDVADMTGISLSSVKKIVTSLKSQGLVRNDGTNRRSRWMLL